MFRYYLTQRPAAPGAIPPGATEVHNYGANGTGFKHMQKTVWGFAEYEHSLTPEDVTNYELTPGGLTPNYYPISEDAARRAKNAYSFSDYIEGSATEEYRRMVDDATYTAIWCMEHTDAMHHDKIRRILDSYSRRLAENMNATNENTARVPSIMIAGGSNFPVRAKEKQNARDDTLRREYLEIAGLISKMESVGTGGISSDDPDAIEKLEAKLERLVKHQELMRAANAAVRLKDTEKGDAKLAELGFTTDEIAELRKPDYLGRVGYPDYELSNNNANIHRTQDRIAELKKRTEQPAEGWDFDGGRVEMNTDANRVQIIYNGKPDEGTRTELKSRGFRWSPRYGAWQRQLNANGIEAAKRVTGRA